jgi:hypothetical protein
MSTQEDYSSERLSSISSNSTNKTIPVGMKDSFSKDVDTPLKKDVMKIINELADDGSKSRYL